MRILKHGKFKSRKFICSSCGCEFVADTREYSTTMCGDIVLWRRCDCPECGNWTETSEPWEENDEQTYL